MKRVLFSIPVAALAVFASSVAFASLAGTTTWRSIQFDLERCQEKAEASFARADCSNIKRSFYAVFGDKDGYTGMVACVPEKEIVYFYVEGPQNFGASKLLDALVSNF